MVTPKLRAERQAVLDELVRLAPPCEINLVPHSYCSLAIGTPPNKNAVIIPRTKNHVSFYIEDSALVERLTNSGFEVEEVEPDSKRLMNKDKFRVLAVTQTLIKNNEVLFGDVLRHTFAVMERRRSNGANAQGQVRR